jgi:hypothetical protein
MTLPDLLFVSVADSAGGIPLLSFIHPSSRLTIVQLIGLGPAVGAGTMGLLLFWVSLIGFAPSRKYWQ